MTDYAEEQTMEVEALESIYLDDFEKLSDAPLKLQVKLVPFPGEHDQNYVGVTLVCNIPSHYPDENPNFELVLEKGLTSVQEKEMKAIIAEKVEENAGMVMVFTVAEAIKEYLVENNREDHGDSEYHQMLKRQQQKTDQDSGAALADEKRGRVSFDEEAAPKFDGTPVNEQTFNAWLESYEAELAAMKKDGSTRKNLKENNLTGKQLFLQGVVDGSDAVEGEDAIEGEAFVPGAVDDTLFLDDDDLDDLEDDDDDDDE